MRARPSAARARVASGSVAKARCISSAVISSAATDGAVDAVELAPCIRAAPRRRARARRRRSRATAASIAGSCAASNAISAASSRVEARRRGVEAAQRRAASRRSWRRAPPRARPPSPARRAAAAPTSRFSLSAAGLTMSRALIGMMSSTATRSFAFSVLPVRHEVDDRVGEADQRRQLHRAVELDQVDVHALRGEVLARGLARTWSRRGCARRAARCPPSRSRASSRPPSGSARSRGRAAGRALRRRARAARPCPRRRRRRRRTARRSARRSRARSRPTRPAGWCRGSACARSPDPRPARCPPRASSGSVSSKMRPLESARVSVGTVGSGWIGRLILPDAARCRPAAHCRAVRTCDGRPAALAAAKRIDVDAAAPREARVDRQRFAAAARHDVDEDPLDAMLVEPGMPAERHEVARAGPRDRSRGPR